MTSVGGMRMRVRAGSARPAARAASRCRRQEGGVCPRDAVFAHDDFHFRGKAAGMFADVEHDAKNQPLKGLASGERSGSQGGEHPFDNFVAAVKPLALDFGVIEVVNRPAGRAGLEQARVFQT